MSRLPFLTRLTSPLASMLLVASATAGVLTTTAVPAAAAVSAGGFVGVDVFFVISGFLIASQLHNEQQQTGRKLGATLTELKFLSEQQLLQFLAQQLNVPFLDIAQKQIDPKAVQLLPEVQARRFRALVLEDRGESVLLGMMTRYTAADVIVVGLIGERGREVRDFVESTLGEEGLRRAVVVASPADRPPLARLHGAYRATAIAEWFRDQGLNVLLLMDSLTRFAQAQREIGLSVGEPPTTRGYPPSVFAKLPALVERAGNGAKGRGSITAFYTVLTEGDDPQDPIADAARAILDGHILLSRRVADSGLYPAIDVESSVSRVVTEIADEPWRLRIRKLKRLVSAYSANRDLIAIGAYQRGNDAATDEALERWPEIMEFLGQDVAKAADLPHSQAALQRLVEQENERLT